MPNNVSIMLKCLNIRRCFIPVMPMPSWRWIAYRPSSLVQLPIPSSPPRSRARARRIASASHDRRVHGHGVALVGGYVDGLVPVASTRGPVGRKTCARQTTNLCRRRPMNHESMVVPDCLRLQILERMAPFFSAHSLPAQSYRGGRDRSRFFSVGLRLFAPI